MLRGCGDTASRGACRPVAGMLHDDDIQPQSSRFAKSMSHQHVLEPELCTNVGAANFARHPLTKAAERLRRGEYHCRRLGLHLSWVGDLGGWCDEVNFYLLSTWSKFGLEGPRVCRLTAGGGSHQRTRLRNQGGGPHLAFYFGTLERCGENEISENGRNAGFLGFCFRYARARA